MERAELSSIANRTPVLQTQKYASPFWSRKEDGRSLRWLEATAEATAHRTVAYLKMNR